MGTQRPNFAGRTDALGRQVKVSDSTVEARATAPAPASKSIVGDKWWDSLPDGATLVDRRRYIPSRDEHVVVFRTTDGREVHVSPWDDDIVHVDEPGADDGPCGMWRGIPMSFPNGTPDRYSDGDDTGWMVGYTIDIEDSDGYTGTFNVTEVTDDTIVGEQWMDDDGSLVTCGVIVHLDTIGRMTVP